MFTLSPDLYTRRIQGLFIVLLLAITLFTLHKFGIDFHLYWIFPWLDLVTHFLGGFMMSLLFCIIIPKKYVAWIIGLFLLTIIGWELFELFIVEIPVPNVRTFFIDTVVDLAVGSVAALLPFFIYLHK